MKVLLTVCSYALFQPQTIKVELINSCFQWTLCKFLTAVTNPVSVNTLQIDSK